MPLATSSFRKQLVASAISLIAVAAAPSVQAETFIALTSNALVTFDSAAPATAISSVPVTGLAAGATLIGIDLRPTTGVLYGVANDGTLYTLNTATGAATFLGSVAGGIPQGGVGIDFNPVPDLAGLASLRLVTAGSNLRINVNGAPATNVDTVLNGATTFLDAVAYTNNDRDPATGTALYGINGGNLYQVTNPNGGVTALIGSLGTTSLNGATGFDVSGLTGASFASLTNPNGQSSFYSVNLATGAATLIGVFGAGFGLVRDITAATNAPLVTAVPEPETYAMMLLGLAGLGWVARRRQRG